MGREVKRRQIGQLSHLQRSLATLHGDAGRVQVGIVGQHLLNQLLQQGVVEELAPRHLGQGLGAHNGTAVQLSERIGRSFHLLFVLIV